MASGYILVLVTCRSRVEARTIVDALIKKRLIACGTIVPPVTSVFRWKGKTEQAHECAFVAKTRRALFRKIALEVKRLHSYEVPEIIAVPIVAGYGPYLSWIEESCA